MSQTTLTDAAYEASDTLEQMAHGAGDTPSLAAFLAETAALIHTLAQRVDTAMSDAESAERAIDKWVSDCHQLTEQNADLTRRLALYETP